MSIEEVITLARCNGNQVQFKRELWDYDGDSEYKYTLQVWHEGKKILVRSHKKDAIFTNGNHTKGSQVESNVNFEEIDERGHSRSVGAILRTNIEFNGSPGRIDLWYYDEKIDGKGMPILSNYIVQNCFPE